MVPFLVFYTAATVSHPERLWESSKLSNIWALSQTVLSM